jgi:hypothetical protein
MLRSEFIRDEYDRLYSIRKSRKLTNNERFIALKHLIANYLWNFFSNKNDFNLKAILNETWFGIKNNRIIYTDLGQLIAQKEVETLETVTKTSKSQLTSKRI